MSMLQGRGAGQHFRLGAGRPTSAMGKRAMSLERNSFYDAGWLARPDVRNLAACALLLAQVSFRLESGGRRVEGATDALL